jgi:prephenate dehydratase
MKRIAIQGIAGSFHDIAAHQYFADDDIELICCNTFEQLFDNVRRDSTVVGLCAIENTIAGSLLHNYELLRESGVYIVGEKKLHISHSFLCLPDDDWDDITEANSHPVALAQCRQFLEEHSNLRVVEASDTAGAARDISEKQLHGHAAICSKYVAPIYGMKVLQEGIETNKHNSTRFHRSHRPASCRCLPRSSLNADKASIVFTLPHEEGSLSQVLSIFSFYKMNLTKIQSLPIIGREWQYMFYVDITFNDYTRYNAKHRRHNTTYTRTFNFRRIQR